MADWSEVLRRKAADLQAPAGAGADPPPPPPACPYCHRPLRDRRCWHCAISVCGCGLAVSSPFILVCRACEVAEYRRLGIPY